MNKKSYGFLFIINFLYSNCFTIRLQTFRKFYIVLLMVCPQISRNLSTIVLLICDLWYLLPLFSFNKTSLSACSRYLNVLHWLVRYVPAFTLLIIAVNSCGYCDKGSYGHVCSEGGTWWTLRPWSWHLWTGFPSQPRT